MEEGEVRDIQRTGRILQATVGFEDEGGRMQRLESSLQEPGVMPAASQQGNADLRFTTMRKRILPTNEMSLEGDSSPKPPQSAWLTP